MEEIQFYPLDIDSTIISGKDYIRLFGRTTKNERICVFEEFEDYFYVIPVKKNVNWVKQQIEEIKVMEDDEKVVYVKRAELCTKKFLGKPCKAIKVILNSSKDINLISEAVKEISGYGSRKELDIPFYKKYLIENKITPLGLCKVEGKEIDTDLEEDICIKGKVSQITEDNIQNVKILSFDIETADPPLSVNDAYTNIPIIMMGLAGNDGFRKCITWKKFNTSNKGIEFVNNEAELLVRFRDAIKEYKPDYIVGYYSDGFDWPYIRSRADFLKINLDLGLDKSKIKFNKKGNSNCVRIKGIPHIDVCRFIKQIMSGDVASGSLQTQSHSLDSVAEEILGENKADVDILKLHDAWEKNEGLEEFCLYNIKDAELCLKIFERILPNINELVKVVSQPIYDVSKMTFGQLIEHYLMKKTRDFNEIIPSRPTFTEKENRSYETYTGGFVYEPKPGLYENLAVLDFRGLHPSIITAHNICMSTLTNDKENSNETPEIDGKRYYFSFKEEGFIPKILKELMERRIRIKEIIKKQEKPDPVLKARNYALKIIAAGFHGYMGYSGARWYNLDCAAATLAYARFYIKKLIWQATKFGFSVIYGDSIGGKTNVIIKKNGIIYEEEIEKLFKNTDSKNLSGKEYNFKKGIKVLTLDNKGKSVFKPIIYVMKHRCNKRMYRIKFTNNWYIDVTEDHSLMGYQNLGFNNSKKRIENPLKRIIEIKPNEIKKKVKSIVTLKSIPYGKEGKNYPEKVYEFMGYFIGDGSFCRNKQHQKHNKDYYLGLSLGLDYKEVIKNLIKPLKDLKYVKNYWLSKTRKGDLKINGLKLIKLISKDFRDKNGKKCIPKWLFEEKEKNITSFLRGLFSSDGTVIMRNGTPIIRYTTIDEGYIKEIRRLLYRVGIANSVFKENKKNIYKTKNKIYSTGSYSKHILIKNKDIFLEKIGFILERKNILSKIKKDEPLQRKHIKQFEFDIQGVKKIEKIKTPKYVYDIEVKDTHRFFANYALVHNTDSVFIELKDKDKKEALKFLKEFNNELPSLMELELEDFYKRGIFVGKKNEKVGAKKRYALINEQGKIKIRGFETVRRDWSKISKEIQSKVIKIILEEKNILKALNYVKEKINNIKENKFNIKDMVIKTQLKKNIDEYTSIGPHVAVARQMLKKNMKVAPGSIIQYVITEGEGLIRDKAKLPEDAKNYDPEYYINHQVLPAIENIFEVVGYKKEDLLNKGSQVKLGDF